MKAAVPYPVVLIHLLLSVALGLASVPALAQLQGHTYSSEDIEAGSRVYTQECALCHGTNGDDIDGVDLRAGRFIRPLSDDDIREVVTIGISDVGMPGVDLPPRQLDGLVAFIRAGFDPAGVAVKVGDAVRGGDLFAGKGECTTCHRVNGHGPRSAPDLSDIGAIRSPASLQRSLLDPTSTMRPINRPLRAVMKDGRTVLGRRLNEDTFTVQVIDEQERLVSLDKSEIVGLELGASSPMPSVEGRLSADELADVVAYLLSLRGLQ